MAANLRNSLKSSDLGSMALWAGQGLLAALFLFAGGMKLVAPAEMLTQGPVVLPVLFLRFIGVCEVLGAIGLILPGVFRVHRELTPAAAVGLVIIMIGAVVVTAMGGQIAPALVPLIVATALISIARGRWATD
jgi:hypothetical protein